MARLPMSFAVVGAGFPNTSGPDRRFEIAMCKPGEPVALRREPRNPHDSRAVAVFSARDIQIGYIRAEQAQWVGSMLSEITAVFQREDTWGAVIRATFDGTVPDLPDEKPRDIRHKRRAESIIDDWPPPEPLDDFGGI